MLNAIVSTKEISTVIEFPIDLYELYRQLNQNGVTQGPHRINIVDDEYADVRVKLYSDSEFGKHIISLMSEKDTLEDLHIEDYIDQHENIDDLATWQRIMEMLKNDLGRKKKDG